MCLLLIENSERLRRSLVADFERAGHDIEAVGDSGRALFSARRRRPDVIVLDLELPGDDGFELVERFRSEARKSRIVLLTGTRSAVDRVKALNSGVDDCLSKPVAFEELLARVRAILRSRDRLRPKGIDIDGLIVDANARRVTRDGTVISLTQREFRILEYLAQRRGRIVSRRELEEHLYRGDDFPMSNAVASAICLLRKKLEATSEEPALIQTMRGRGYRLGTPVFSKGA